MSSLPPLEISLFHNSIKCWARGVGIRKCFVNYTMRGAICFNALVTQEIQLNNSQERNKTVILLSYKLCLFWWRAKDHRYIASSRWLHWSLFFARRTRWKSQLVFDIENLTSFNPFKLLGFSISGTDDRNCKYIFMLFSFKGCKRAVCKGRCTDRPPLHHLVHWENLSLFNGDTHEPLICVTAGNPQLYCGL